MDIKIINIGSKVIEDNFSLSRPNGLITRYDFIHFLTEVTITIKGETKTYAPGICVLYTPEFSQYYKHVNGWINHDWIEFECNDVQILQELKIPFNKPFYTQISNKITEQIEKLKKIYSSDNIFTQAELLCEFYSLIILISKHLHSNQTDSYGKAKKQNRDFLTNLRLEMYQNPTNINVKKIAKSHGFTESHLCTIFKKTFQITVHEDLTKARLLYVERLLKEGKSPQSISENLGFSSVEYLYMWFKKQTGQTVKSFLKN